MPPTFTIPNPVTVYSHWITTLVDYRNHYRDIALEWIGVKAAPAMTWRRLDVRWHWLSSADPKDDMICTFDIVNITAGDIDSSWTSADYTNVEGKFDTFLGTVAAFQHNQCSLAEYKWYVRSFNDYSDPKPFAPHGAPERVTPKSVAGAIASPQAPQVAFCITERTDFPRNWGRFYLPAIAANKSTTTSIPTVLTTTVDSLVDAAGLLNTQLHSSDFQLVVPITKLGTGGRGEPGEGSANRRLSSVTKFAGDNAWDVIRRRHVRTPTYHHVIP